MKKSTAYRLAQFAVVESELDAADKLEVLKRLLDDEALALFCEKEQAVSEA